MLDLVLEKGVEPLKWLIVIGIAYTLAMTVIVFFETPVTAPLNKAQVATATSEQRAAPNINLILNQHLFGEAGVESPVVQQQTTSVQTRLPLELQSVFVAYEPELSTAIVAQKGKAGRMYHVGDELPGNAKLVEITHDQIYLRRAGVRETLPFPKSSSAVSFEPELVEPEEEELPLLDDDVGDERLDEEEDEEALRAEELADYQQQLADDPEGALDELGLEAAEGGGYRIGTSAVDRYLQQSGLQTGDVIISINGQPVGDIQQDRAQLDELIAQGAARIEVQRGSRRFFVTARLPN